MKTTKRIGVVLFFLIELFFLSSSQLFARNAGTHLEIGADDQLKIVIYKDGDQYHPPLYPATSDPARNGQMMVYRNGQAQYAFTEEILAVRLKDVNPNKSAVRTNETVFTSNRVFGNNLSADSGYGTFPGYNEGNTIVNKIFSNIDDGPSNTTGQEQYVTKIFHGSHSYSQPNGSGGALTATFTIIWTIRYNTSLPDRITMTAEVHAGNLPSYVEISLGYGFDSFVNGCDFSSAVILPDMGLNGWFEFYQVNLPFTPKIKETELVATKNTYGSGSVFGYYPIATPFDKIAATIHSNSHGYKVVSQDKNPFNFGPYNPCDQFYQGIANRYSLGCGVAYNLTAGIVNNIETGMIFGDNDTNIDFQRKVFLPVNRISVE